MVLPKLFRVIFSLLMVLVLMSSSIRAEQPSFDLTARSALLMEFESGEILFEKNPQEELPPASMAKIMTMLLVVEALEQGRANLSEQLVVSELSASMGGSQIWLEPGEEMSLEDMMKAIAIVSANDACVAVAEYLYGTEEDFVKRMNERASELGLKNTYYSNTNGLPSEDPEVQGNYTSARDLAVLAREILKYPQVLDWTSTWIDYLRDGESVLNNTNRLVRHYQGADGLKTGHTEEARFCVTSTAEKKGIRFISVIMGAENSKKRFAEAAALLSYGFSSYQGLEIAGAGDIIKELEIRNAKEEKVAGIVTEQIIVPVKKGEEDSIKKEIVISEGLKAPLQKGDPIGEIKIFKGNLLVKRVDIVVNRDVEKASFFQLVMRIVKHLLAGMIALFK